MSTETERMLAEGPRSAPEAQTAAAGAAVAPGSVVPSQQRSPGRVARSLFVLLALVVLVGMTIGHLLGPGAFLALWVAVGVVQFLLRRRRR